MVWGYVAILVAEKFNFFEKKMKKEAEIKRNEEASDQKLLFLAERTEHEKGSVIV